MKPRRVIPAAQRTAPALLIAATLAAAPVGAAPRLDAAPQAVYGWNVHERLFGTQAQIGPVIVYNMNRFARLYLAHSCGYPIPDEGNTCSDGQSFTLPAASLCRLDNWTYPGEVWGSNARHFDPGIETHLEDFTDGPVGSFNANWMTGNDNFDSCANEGSNSCAGARWGSWMVGMMALQGVVGPRSGASMAPGVEYWVENSWDSGQAIEYSNDWIGTPIALILTHGSTDGSRFDIRNNNGVGLPTPQQVFEAPLCARFYQAADRAAPVATGSTSTSKESR
jgi:hypothetical protein